MGDVDRAKADERNSVGINTSFTYLQGLEYMKARSIFLEKTNINALPIIDEEYKLIGDYSRWDDAYSTYIFDLLKGSKWTDRIGKNIEKLRLLSQICHPRKNKKF